MPDIPTLAREAVSLLKQGIPIHEVKHLIAQRYHVFLRNSDILTAVPLEDTELRNRLRLKPTRTLSGVAPVAIMDKSPCPGTCAYCPRGEDAAQSYTGLEPASLRARQAHYDPFLQVQHRVRQYEEIGHPTDKCELIIMGGTFNAQPRDYQEWFVKRAFDAFNGMDARDLAHAHELNEHAPHRVVGMTIETRPDFAQGARVHELLRLGTTRVEIGVQTLREEVYRKVNRGHTVEDVVRATKECRNAGLKICYHMMLGLFSTPEEDIAMLRTLFESEDFRPDMLKLYPTLVIEGTPLYDLWKKGEFQPYDTETASRVIAEAFRFIPPYVRIMRVQRDIPVSRIAAGVKKSNVRQYAYAYAMEEGIPIAEIRAREVGERIRKNICLHDADDPPSLRTLSYRAHDGTEYFLSLESRGIVHGFLRLRIPFLNDPRRAIIRELHVYGRTVSIGRRSSDSLDVQHRGIGKQLLSHAEECARACGCTSISVLSGVGVRPYYLRLGYQRDLPYLTKLLS